MVDVSDVFDGFYRVVATLWREFGDTFAAPDRDEAAEEALSFDELADQLEVDLFFPACARRLHAATGERLDPDDVAPRLRLVAETGEPLPGPAGRYHSHAFHPPGPQNDVPCAVLAGNLMSVPRAGIRIQLDTGPQQRVRDSRRQLPVH
jgi:hypothetical protein